METFEKKYKAVFKEVKKVHSDKLPFIGFIEIKGIVPEYNILNGWRKRLNKKSKGWVKNEEPSSLEIKMIKGFEVLSTNRYELINITDKIEAAIKQGRVENGLVFVFTPHSTAAIVLTEDEPGLKEDWLNVLKKLVSGFDFLHNKIDDNADSHILSGLIGQGKTLMIEMGRLIRGPWQQIFLVELDGPRSRKITIKILKGA